LQVHYSGKHSGAADVSLVDQRRRVQRDRGRGQTEGMGSLPDQEDTCTDVGRLISILRDPFSEKTNFDPFLKEFGKIDKIRK
jgi:hypothetical protein